MGKFFRTIGMALFIELFIVLIALTIIDKIGLSDSFYKRFTSNDSSSLIVGSSRSAQSIQPQIIDELISGKHSIYNFSGTVSATPFGRLYFKRIQEKILNGVDDNSGLFIISVDPFVLAEDEIWDKFLFREYKSGITFTRPFTKPNYLYLIKNCRPNQWMSPSIVSLQDDGWLCVDFPNIDDTVIVRHNIELKIADYSERRLHKSGYRMKWLYETIKLFKSRGDVYMCRIPVSKEMKAIEDSQWPDFDEDMRKVSSEMNVPYFSFINEYSNFRTTDGNHLYKEDGAKFTLALCDSIREYRSHF